MPIAIAYGWDDALPFVASIPLAHPPSEYEVIGAIRQEPVELARWDAGRADRPSRRLPSHASGQDAEREERIIWLA